MAAAFIFQAIEHNMYRRGEATSPACGIDPPLVLVNSFTDTF